MMYKLRTIERLILNLLAAIFIQQDFVRCTAEESMATSSNAITVAEGFQVDLVYSVPLDEQGSWVSMTCDSKGRLICSDQGGGLYRITLGSPMIVEPLSVEIGRAQGLLFAHESLYVVVSGAQREPGVYRVRDTDQDDVFDSVVLLAEFSNLTSKARRSVKQAIQNRLIRSGHGPHGISLDSTGHLLVMVGNHTTLPNDLAESPYRNWDEDLLLPRLPDAQGIATGIKAPGGYVLRMDKDGTNKTLFCGGLRNAYDLAVDANGEVFTFDSDMEFDSGTPWYRPSRVNHLVSGGEYGWRYGTGKWPDYFTDSLGSVVDVGFGSPTGLVFGTAARFPARYQRAMFAGDWAMGKLYAFHLQPQQSGFRAEFEVFLEGKPLAITDMIVHPDGCLYFLIGGRRSQSGLYRVSYVGGESTERVSPISSPPSRRARTLRKQLEAFHTIQNSRCLEVAWQNLNSNDRSVRYAARLAVERQPLELWLRNALSEERVTASIQAAVALCRVGESSHQRAVVSRLNRLPFGKMSDLQQLQALRAYQLAFIRLGDSQSDLKGEVIHKLSPLFPAQNTFVNRELCRLLVYLDAPDVIDRALKLVDSAGTQEDQMFYIFQLRNLKSGWTDQHRRDYLRWTLRASTDFRGGKSFTGFVRQTYEDATNMLSHDEKSTIEQSMPVSVGTVETPQSAPLQFVHNWQMSDLLPKLNMTKTGRSFRNGKSAYQSAQCARCHRIQGNGGATGPDLTTVGNRFSPKYLLEALLKPSTVIPDQYRNWVLTTAEGEVVSGRIVSEDDDQLVVRSNPFAEEMIRVKVADVEERRLSTVSEMPAGLTNVLTEEQILDLLAYLISGGQSGDPAFDDRPGSELRHQDSQ